MNRQISRWLPVFLWAALIFFLSSLPQQETSKVFAIDFIIKKTAHLLEYAILYFLFYRATTGKIVTSFVLAILYAATDEFHQSFVPGRTSRINDVIGFDLVGISISAYLLWKLKRVPPSKHSK